MLSPERAVFVGGAVLEPAIAYCRARGFAGPVDVVNPSRTEIAGIRCLPSIEDLEATPDVAFLAVPKEAVAESVAALAAQGTGGTVCNASGSLRNVAPSTVSRVLAQLNPLPPPAIPPTTTFAPAACK